jgi:hypothetical protein
MCQCDAQRIPSANLHDVIANTHARVGTIANLDDVTAKADARLGTTDSAQADVPRRFGADEIGKGEVHVGTAELAKAEAHVGAAESVRADARPRRRAGVAPAGVKRQRARQDTPPAIRREVFWRDRGRCVVPGCRNASYVDLHHLELRSEGGGNDPDNLVLLCGAHHGALHRGRLQIDGKVSTGLSVRHADGTAYGCAPAPALVEASARAFAGLRNLGFSEKTARASLEHAISAAPANATAETLLRSAVARASAC